MKTTFTKILLAIFLALIAIFVVSISLYTIMAKPEKYTLKPGRLELSTWLWSSPDDFKSESLEQLLINAKNVGIETIYIDISKYIDIIENKDYEMVDNELLEFEIAQRLFIAEANKREINVHALAGEVHWAKSSHSYIPTAIKEYVLEFNTKYPDTVYEGIQYDIEYYSQADYKNNQQDYSYEYLELLRTLTNTTNNDHGIKMSFALTYWLDNQNDNQSEVEWNNTTKFPIFHILDVLSENRNTSLILMAYRTEIEGPFGIVNLVQDELNYIKAKDYNTQVTIALETANTPEHNISFFNLGKKKFQEVLLNLGEIYSSELLIKGFAVNDLESYLNLK